MITSIRRSRLAVAAVAAVTLTTVFGAGDVFAEGETVTINACTDKFGNLRIVNDPTTCKAHETPLTWNVQGPQGLPGPQGEQGIQGVPGPAGVQGATGPQGAIGPIGPAGPQGLKGDTGDVGPRGLQGERGFTGPTGPQGPAGPSGVVFARQASGDAPAPGPLANGVAFLAPTVIVNVGGGQTVHVFSQRALGTTAPGGAQELRLDICYQSTAAGSPIMSFDNDAMYGLAIAQGMRMPFSLSDQFNLSSGQYAVGLCGAVAGSDKAAAWNSNEWGRTSVFVTQL